MKTTDHKQFYVMSYEIIPDDQWDPGEHESDDFTDLLAALAYSRDAARRVMEACCRDIETVISIDCERVQKDKYNVDYHWHTLPQEEEALLKRFGYTLSDLEQYISKQ